MGSSKQAVITQQNSCEYRIYGLVNKKDNTIFYIGLTTLPLELRLSGHISGGVNCRKGGIKTDTYLYIRRLLSKGIEIGIMEIFYFSTCDKKEALELESYTIHKTNGVYNTLHNKGRKGLSKETIRELKKMGYGE